jgi:hypothetical protein
MIYGVKKIARYILGTDIAGRTIAVRPGDTFIVSYPRSGNTWTRFLLANLLYPNKEITFKNIEQLIPDAEAQSSRYLKNVPSPRFIKTHQYFDHRYGKVIYIVRDPRDVVLSYYDFSRKNGHIPDGFSLDRYVSDFVGARLSSASWGTWAENVGTWVAARQGQPTFLLLRYEDLIAQTEVELARVAQFLNLIATRERIAVAVQNCSAERMREMEKTQSADWISTKNKRPDIPFVGTAIQGKWKSRLSPEAVLQIESAWGSLMVHLGYTLSAASSEDLKRNEALVREVIAHWPPVV